MTDKAMPKDAKGAAGIVLLGPGDSAEDAAARLGIPVGDFWRELDAGRVVTIYLRLPEDKKARSR